MENQHADGKSIPFVDIKLKRVTQSPEITRRLDTPIEMAMVGPLFALVVTNPGIESLNVLKGRNGNAANAGAA